MRSAVLEHAMLAIRPGQEQAFEAAFAKAQNIISASLGYLSHRLERCVEHPSRYLLLVEWSDIEAHTVGFRGSAEYDQWRALLHHFYDPFPTVLHFRNVYASTDAPMEFDDE